MATKGRGGLDSEIDALFRLSLSDFTTTRNALASRLKREKLPVDAERVKSLAKPTAPAWAVNQIYWENPGAFDELLDVGERIRKAQTGRLKNVDVRELFDEKKRLTAGLLERASAALTAAGHSASPDAMRRVSATLESLAVWGTTAGAPAVGRLTADLDPPGFEALAAVMGGTKFDTAKVLSFRTPKPVEDPAVARARAREVVQAAEKTLRETRREFDRAEATLAKLRARSAAIEKEREEIERRYAQAREDLRKASAEAKHAADAVSRAERSVADAKSKL